MRDQTVEQLVKINFNVSERVVKRVGGVLEQIGELHGKNMKIEADRQKQIFTRKYKKLLKGDKTNFHLRC